MRPATMFTTRSAADATSRSWVTITIVMPCSARRFWKSSRVCSTEAGSRLPVGSSASRISGAFAKARGERDPLTLSSRELRGFPVGLVGEVDLGQEFFGADAALAARAVSAEHRDLDVSARVEVREQVVQLEHESDDLSSIPVEIRHFPKVLTVDRRRRRRLVGRGRQ